MKTVYACFTTDVIHEGHLNIIRVAKSYGRLVVGVMSIRRSCVLTGSPLKPKKNESR